MAEEAEYVEYDEEGNMIEYEEQEVYEEQEFDEHGNPIQYEEYDEDGNLIEYEEYDEDNNDATAEAEEEEEIEYVDEDGNRISKEEAEQGDVVVEEQEYYEDEDGNPVDADGNLISDDDDDAAEDFLEFDDAEDAEEGAARAQAEAQEQEPSEVQELAAAVGAVGLAGPAWTQGSMEPPAGEKNMGTWTSAVYTEEQQARLGVDETGQAVESSAAAAAVAATDDAASEAEAPAAAAAADTPVVVDEAGKKDAKPKRKLEKPAEWAELEGKRLYQPRHTKPKPDFIPEAVRIQREFEQLCATRKSPYAGNRRPKSTTPKPFNLSKRMLPPAQYLTHEEREEQLLKSLPGYPHFRFKARPVPVAGSDGRPDYANGYSPQSKISKLRGSPLRMSRTPPVKRNIMSKKAVSQTPQPKRSVPKSKATKLKATATPKQGLTATPKKAAPAQAPAASGAITLRGKGKNKKK